jgi:uncharacterized protein with GYD domain
VSLVPASGPVGVADTDDPASHAEMADSLSLVFLVLLETLSPEQRAAFLLREVFDYPGGGVAAMSKYAVFFTLKAEAIARAMEQPSDRVVVVSKAVESAGGKLEAYYLMFGQYDGFVIVDLPDSRAAAATSLAVSSTGAFEHLETHELIEAEDLNPILEQAKGITSQLPGT